MGIPPRTVLVWVPSTEVVFGLQGQVISCLKTSREASHRKTGNAASVSVCLSSSSCELGHQLLRRVDIRPEVLGQSARGTAATHPTIQGKATTVRELGESRKESPRLSVREYVNNGLEEDYYPPNTDNGYREYLSPTGHIAMARLLDNFRDFIARAGYRILQVPDTPREYVGQYLLFAYLDQFVQQVRGAMHLEVQTGRGRADLVIFHQGRKYIVETKIWQGELSYRAGKEQLSAYLKLEGVPEGYYIVFAHRETPVPRVDTETVDGLTIRSYVLPVRQKRPSAPTTEEAS